MKLDKYDLGLAKLASKEKARPILCNVQLKDGRFAVTDVYMLVIRDASLEKGETIPETLLPAKMLETIKASLTRVPHLSRTNGRVEVTYKTALDKPQEFEPSMSFKPIEATYPKTDQLLRLPSQKKAQVAVSVKLLQKLLSCLPPEGILRIGITGPDEPVEFAVTNIERPMRGVIMQMSVPWSGDSFQWYNDAYPKKEDTKKEG